MYSPEFWQILCGFYWVFYENCKLSCIIKITGHISGIIFKISNKIVNRMLKTLNWFHNETGNWFQHGGWSEDSAELTFALGQTMLPFLILLVCIKKHMSWQGH